jgi:hypothetical protein
MRLWKDVTDQFHDIIVIIVGEEILGLAGHQSGNKSKEGHFYVLMQWLF